MSSILKTIEAPFKTVGNIPKDISKEATKIKKDVENVVDEIEYGIDLVGEYLLFGFIVTGLIAIPLLNEISKKIPEAIESAAKIADIVKPI